MAIVFRIADHNILPGVKVVEVLVNGDVAAVLYPEGEKGFKITSAHIAEFSVKEQLVGELVPEHEDELAPAVRDVHILLNPMQYIIEDGRVVKIPVSQNPPP